MGRKSYRKSRKSRRKRRSKKSEKFYGLASRIHKMRYKPDVVQGLGELASKQIYKFARKIFVNEKAKVYFRMCATSGDPVKKHNWAMLIHSCPLKRRLIVAGWLLGNLESCQTFDVMNDGEREMVRDAVVKGMAHHARFLLDQTDPIQVRNYRAIRKEQLNAWKTSHASIIAGVVGSRM